MKGRGGKRFKSGGSKRKRKNRRGMLTTCRVTSSEMTIERISRVEGI